MLLQLLLRSMLTGKQLDTGELLAILLTGKPPAASTSPAPPQPSPPAPEPVPERMTGKPWPGMTPAEPQKKPDLPQTPAQPATSRPSVQLSTGALAISTILQALGVVGTPFGMGPTPTPTGTLARLIPIITGVVGATGGLGTLLNAGRSLPGGFAGAAGKPR